MRERERERDSECTTDLIYDGCIGKCVMMTMRTRTGAKFEVVEKGD